MRYTAFTAALCLLLAAAPATVLADPPVADESSHTCKLTTSSIRFGERYAVACDTPWKNPSTSAPANWFAIATTDAAAVQQAIAVAQAAMAANKSVQVRFRTQSSGNPPSCNPADCRRLVELRYLK